MTEEGNTPERKALPDLLQELDYELELSIIAALKPNSEWKRWANRIYPERRKWDHLDSAEKFYEEWCNGSDGTTEKLWQLAQIFDRRDIRDKFCNIYTYFLPFCSRVSVPSSWLEPISPFNRGQSPPSVKPTTGVERSCQTEDPVVVDSNTGGSLFQIEGLLIPLFKQQFESFCINQFDFKDETYFVRIEDLDFGRSFLPKSIDFSAKFDTQLNSTAEFTIESQV